ncbi:M48 family metallopeptidase [Paludibacterium yongneupense]|uniref:M48 family metallopeptidase n=1 Tax=Paludibacterium yongneupense TaxID=400061 RepID=UPI000561FBB0|nr:SprT family zinc-dependent metalloprotease [Paludibacterium yongneupense]
MNTALALTLPDVTLPVTVVRRARKSIGIRVSPAGVELVAHPRVTLAYLQQVLDDRRDWIERHWRLQNAARAPLVPEAVRLAGHGLRLVHENGARRRVLFEGDRARVFGLASDDGDGLRRVLADGLRREAALRFPPRLAAAARAAARAPSGFALSSARTRWGSCSGQGMIRLNWRLVQAPLAILDYVIAHELAHLRHMDHSPAFWLETARLCPQWRVARNWLREQGRTLFEFG